MQAGLSRAIPMAIIGFMIGALITIVLRGLQSLDPIWAAGPGLVMAGFFMAGFFVWGMGAFNPKLSVHGEAEEAVHEELENEAAQPRSLLLGSTWMIATITLIVVVILAVLAVIPGGFGMTQTITPGASTSMVGYTEMPLPFGGPTIVVSTLVIFGVFILIAFLSLAAAAWVFGFLLTFLSTGLTELKTAGGGTAALPAPTEPAKPRTTLDLIKTIAIFVVTFIILYLFFYYVAIGLILPQPSLPVLSLFMSNPLQLIMLSLVNAIIFTFLILRPSLVLQVIGIVARWLARVLRSVPRFLQ
jgi:hypothetical protein